jgi:hypothetical protein
MSTTTTTPPATPSPLAAFEAEFGVVETDIVAWINQAWTEVQAVESWIDNQLTTIAGWLAANLQTIDGVLSTVSTLVPASAPEIAAAETALEAASVASAALAAGLKAGSTPVTTINNAYAAVNYATIAVKNVLAIAAAPTATPAS